jgi:hypothetical protein
MPGFGITQARGPSNHAKPKRLGSEQVIIKMLRLMFFYKKIFKLSLKYFKQKSKFINYLQTTNHHKNLI